ncbi:MAG TPA: T6SS immunity protein Tdi1 domain-containing protein [Methylomirabilota bacterium]|nr:T6SS immunity protein Tdi1 domain-containing protein [Methylomirabilota bacterium]
MAIPVHLTAKLDGIAVENLLSDWQWLVRGKFTPVLMTAFGDLFLRNEAGQIYFLDLMCGEFNQVASSQEEFENLCDDREQRRKWFIGHFIMELRKLHGELDSGQCFSCKIPLSLGGKLEASNFARIDFQVHYSVLGQLHRQTKHLPPGTKIDRIVTD